MRFRMAQCLCDQRHAILGFAIDDLDATNDEIIEMIQVAIAALICGEGKIVGAPVEKINPYCGLCGGKSETWTYEVALSREFSSWEEAQKVLVAVEKQQKRTHEWMDALGFSYDSKMWRKRAESN